MQIRKMYLPSGIPCDTTRRFVEDKPESITIHYTGPLPMQTPDQVRKYWIDCKGEASAHYIIKDSDCLQCWPTYKVAWHAGNAEGNATSLGIEVIPCNKEGTFSQSSIDTLRELIKYLRGTIARALPLKRHFDWSGKQCPAWYVDEERWKSLKEQIGG